MYDNPKRICKQRLSNVCIHFWDLVFLRSSVQNHVIFQKFLMKYIHICIYIFVYISGGPASGVYVLRSVVTRCQIRWNLAGMMTFKLIGNAWQVIMGEGRYHPEPFPTVRISYQTEPSHQLAFKTAMANAVSLLIPQINGCKAKHNRNLF